MDDYLSEKEQWEAIKAGARENGPWIAIGIAAGAAIWGGLAWYWHHQDEAGSRASAKYNQIVKDFREDERTQAFVLIGELEREYPSSPYVDQAKLAAARVYVESNDLDKAAAELQGVADHSRDSGLATVAKLRLARVQIAQNKPDLALATLNGVQPGAFATGYHEILGDAYYAKGDKPGALKEYLTAKVGDIGGSGDTRELDLKIADLSADGVRVAAQAPANNPAAK